MNYIQSRQLKQDTSHCFTDGLVRDEQSFLKIPSILSGFINTDTVIGTTVSRRRIYNFKGYLKETKHTMLCPHCGNKMHIHGTYSTRLRHLPFGATLSCVSFSKKRFKCPYCSYTEFQTVPFKAIKHNITKELLVFVRDLLSFGLTNKEVAEISGLGKNTIKEIDMARLRDKYTINGVVLKKPERQAKYIGIDEFKLHNGYRYATLIVDLETGHILWLAQGKKKSSVYGFIEHVGQEWIDNVEAVACDMNSDFQEAVDECCPYATVVFDYFHLIQNLNKKVISEIRKDEQVRLLKEGNLKAARALKKSKYILMSSKETLKIRDAESSSGKLRHKGSCLFKTIDIKRGNAYTVRYEKLISNNKLLFTCDLIKEKLKNAYSLRDGAQMAEEIIDVIDICVATKNTHMLWFAKILNKNFEGIIAHADYPISNGKVEGINNKIKTLRRQGYGYPDDEYFFLKLLDVSRKKYIRNTKTHKICD